MRGQLIALVARLRRLWLPLTVGFFVIVYIAFGVVYFQQQGEQSDLNAQIAQQNATLQQLPRDEDIQDDIDQAQAELEAAQAIFPTNLNYARGDVKDELERLASETRVTLGGDPSPIEAPEVISGISYQVLRYTVTAEGDYEQLENFITALDSGPTSLPSLIVTKVTLDLDEGSASLDFTVYILSGG